MRCQFPAATGRRSDFRAVPRNCLDTVLLFTPSALHIVASAKKGALQAKARFAPVVFTGHANPRNSRRAASRH